MNTTALWITMGDHTGHSRRLARGLRAMCRPVPEHWQGDYADREATTSDITAWLHTIARPAGTVVTWVPGHDGTPGPGAEFATIIASAWSLPIQALVLRRQPIRSAHTWATRPDQLEQRQTLTATPGAADVIVVDNAVGSGASMAAATAALAAAGHNITAVLTITRTRQADDRHHIDWHNEGQHLF